MAGLQPLRSRRGPTIRESARMTVTPDLNERDLGLVRRFQAGDDRAFDELVQAHRREIYRLAYRLLGNHADADDLAQEAFLRVYRSLARFRRESSFRTWLTRIVLNLAADRRSERSAMRQVSLEEVQPGEMGVEMGSAAPGFPFAERAVQRAVGLLPPRQRETLILRIFQGMKFQEIATVMGCTVSTAKANFFHALKGLRERVRV